MAWGPWSYEGSPLQPGAYVPGVRSTDGTGTLRSAMDHSFAPKGTTGYHYMTVCVES
jgi:hypothetical protein